MCILSKSGVSTETAIVVFPDSLIYINELIDHDKGGDRKAPCMCFSFNGKVKSSKVTTSEDFDDILKLHQETEIYYTLGTDSADFVQITESGGYEIYTGPREQVYEKALENYPESEKFLKPLIDDEITHGENAVYAVPVNAKNDWTAIQINFEKNLRPEEIIFPLCHEISGYNKYYFTQLLIISEELATGRSPRPEVKSFGQRPFHGRCHYFKTDPFATSCGYAYIHRKPLKVNDRVLNNAMVYRLDVLGSPVNNNLRLTDLI